ncbi:aldo/keto reductase [Actinomadura sp. ATCC 31491]|uniref:Aldo/keto reductase n=1 Tax=Actinomadura luzonensis TaxID=2805427 RepID=A0ABT0GBU3_9ACTN|nr:aldo/keto reductase [Actinomadura luzonensis]MCK2221954.1 aldo/keto reductase [Actinomadura luzonensis]
MRTRPLGRTGIKVSPYCLGTMMFGPFGNPDPDACVAIVHRALDAGINFIDTADVYGGDGETERIVGKALRGRRDDVVLATKFNGPMGADPNQRGSSRRWIVTAAENSLRRLGVDHLDLYQVHHPEPGTDIEETLAALTDLMQAGKVRAIGHSSLPAAEIVEAQWASERRGLARFRTEQPPYSILNRMLTGRYRKGGNEQVSDARMRWVPRHMTDKRNHDAVEELVPIAEQAGLSLTHLALAFVISHPAVSSAIIGPRTMAQLEDLLAGAGTTLDDDTLDRIDQVVPPGVNPGTLDIAYVPPALERADLRRRRTGDRAAA